MVLPEEIGDAAQDAADDDVTRVRAWLDSGGNVNDADKDGFTLIHCCSLGDREEASLTEAHISLAKRLISLGADVNTCDSSARDTPLLAVMERASYGGEASLKLVELLLRAKANPNAKNDYHETPIKHALAMDMEPPQLGPETGKPLTVLRMLLSAGASLDWSGSNGEERTAEGTLGSYYDDTPLANNASIVAIKALFAGVRKHGTYKRYMRAPHREVLAVRGLAQRGKLEVPLWPTVRTGELFGKWSTEHSALNFLARLGDNGVCWHILTYWRGTD